MNDAPICEQPPVQARYFQRINNVGDAIAPEILAAATGRSVYAVRSDCVPHILSIGSMLQTATPHSFVWGTGLIHPAVGIGQLDATRVLAVRGKRTYEAIAREGTRLADVPLGDPGILVDPTGRSDAKRYALGLVPHYVDRTHPFFTESAKDPSIAVLDVCGPPAAFLATLAMCEVVASSSLHGLIFAEAYGLPTLWLDMSGKVLGDGFKFHDWFSLASNPQSSPYRPKTADGVGEILRRAEPRDIHIDKSALRNALTSDVIEACSLPTGGRRRLRPIAECRQRPLPVFALCRNDVAGLRAIIAGLARQTKATELVICDDRSDEPSCLQLIAQLERSGLCSVRRRAGDIETDPAWIDRLISDFFADWAEPARFAVTRCDARPVFPTSHSIADYVDLLDRCPSADRIGAAEPFRHEDDRREMVALDLDGRYAGGAYDGLVVPEDVDPGFAVYRSGQRLAASMTTLLVRPSSDRAALR